eukprot:CAMPEP_0196588864 /NCGR_PEP_ID=MMETSP1081-20130531/61953_1 /TAXON_ID=36882 /ORGANISM="Pyramimonas amylifera, Strain CCMP720" /LENGTH=410 /DNA_ID=CAMNT_0041911493 /DNA_START=119 /DNA_END=1351 /DNA_ORIENTATION=-
MKQIGRANVSIDDSDKTRNISCVSMDTGVKTTVDNDNRVDQALRSKINQSTKLKSILESSIDHTNIELQKMNAIKKHLEFEKNINLKHWNVNTDRRGHRSQRPPRELVHDVPHKELKKQSELLKETQERYDARISDVDRNIIKLKSIRGHLAADREDKRSALDLDKTCKDLCAVDGTMVSLNMLPKNKSVGEPYAWRKSTMVAAEEAQTAHRQAQALRRNCFHLEHRRKIMEKEQHDILQRSLSSRVDQITKLKDNLTAQHAHVEDEISKAYKIKRKLEDAIAEKMPPLNLAKQRYHTRNKRPDRESVHDEVEHALLMQYNELKKCVEDLQSKHHAVCSHVAQLEKTRADLKMNIADKTRNLKLDLTCLGMAPTRPATGASLNSDALSLRPATGSTLGNFNMRQSMSALE